MHLAQALGLAPASLAGGGKDLAQDLKDSAMTCAGGPLAIISGHGLDHGLGLTLHHWAGRDL